MKKQHYYGLLVVLLCGLAAASIGVCSNCVGVFYSPVSDELHILRGSFAFHATLSLLATAGISFAVPGLMKRISYRLLLIAGVAVSVLSTIGMAYSNALWQFYVLGTLRGLGTGLFANVPLTIIVNNWFHEKHGLATSVMLSFSGVAGAACSPLLTACIQHFGWSHAYLVMAGLLLVFALPALILPIAAKPETLGMQAYGTAAAAKQETASPAFSYRDPRFICMCAIGLMHPAITGIAQHFTGFSGSIGLTAEVGALMMSLSMMGNILTKLVIGVLSDRFNSVRACLTMIAVNILSLVMLWFGSRTGNAPVLYAASLLYGSVYSVGAVGISLLCRYFFGSGNYSRVYTVIGPIVSAGAAVSLPLIGYLYDFTGSYMLMLAAALCIHAADLVLLFTALRFHKRIAA